jgi:hypothetical protein
MSQHEDTVVSEDAIRLQSMKQRMVRIEATEVQVRKLNHVLSSMAVSEKPRQLSLLRQASRYTATVADTAPAGLRKSINVIANELQSLREGIVADSVTTSDLVLVSGVKAIKEIAALKAKLTGYITRAESRLSSEVVGSPAESLLLKTKELTTTIPNLHGKDYAVIRAPVAFSFMAPNGKHSSVGYVDSTKLYQLGFKVDNLEGYTIIHNQMLIGVNTDALYVQNEKGEKQLDVVHEKGVKFKADKPIKVIHKRPKTLVDVANEVMQLIEAKTKTPYALVSTTPARQSGALWFWASPAKDITRMGKAFPGGHMKVTHWGPAFPAEQTEQEAKEAWKKKQEERRKLQEQQDHA